MTLIKAYRYFYTMIIHANTKISVIIKHHPAALDAIVRISPKFEKLRNPVLRKLMASRTTIAMAAKIGGCQPGDIFEKLAPLGFEIDTTTIAAVVVQPIPVFMQHVKDEIVLDVRPTIAAGNDPLSEILGTIKTLKSGQVLKIVNTFEPTPLMLLLGKQGFESYANHVDDQLVETWFYKTQEVAEMPIGQWDDAITRFKDRMMIIDVRQLEMPLPMMTILESLDNLTADKALFVYHKRIPVFLLPELALRKLSYRVKEISADEVHLLIFKD